MHHLRHKRAAHGHTQTRPAQAQSVTPLLHRICIFERAIQGVLHHAPKTSALAHSRAVKH